MTIEGHCFIFLQYVCERHFQKIFGRSDFKTFFDNLQEEHIFLPKVGVFSCGPPTLTNAVEEACSATNRFEGPAFDHHFKNF